MTATPKETHEVSNSDYFGDPIYTYSLKEGIEDGFLAPYKVVRVDIDVDLQGWRPVRGQSDLNGELIDDRIYNQKDFDRTMVIDERTELVAKPLPITSNAPIRWIKPSCFAKTFRMPNACAGR